MTRILTFKPHNMPLIIYVDDDKEDANFFLKAIHEISNQVVVYYAQCGTDLFELLENVVPEFIFLDVHMPDEDGLGCLKKIRGQEKYDSIPVVIYSSSDAHVEACFKEKANFYIKKPNRFPEIVAALQQVLGSNALKFNETPRERFLIN